MKRIGRVLAGGGFALAAWLAAASAAAQETPTTAAPAGCYRFAFAVWTPPLDWRAAGHDWGPGSLIPARSPSSDSVEGAPNVPGAPAASGAIGRPATDRAQRELAMWESERGDSVLVLYPAWWPVGVVVRLESPAALTGDTLRGVATAFVADARVTAPRSDVRAWRGRCGG